ncbi:MAG: tetratricopeptide repeat protein, partial [candidate division NC10 bacterium]
ATQQQLKQERQNVAALTEEATRYREGTAELQRRVSELDKSLDEHRYYVLVNEALAYTYRKGAGDKERAEAAYRNAIQMAKAKEIQDPVIYNAYALFLQEERRFEEAETFYKMALEVKPGYGTALYNLGTLYEMRGDLKQALEYYQAADEVGEKLGRENYLRLQSIIKK